MYEDVKIICGLNNRRYRFMPGFWWARKTFKKDEGDFAQVIVSTLVDIGVKMYQT